LLREGLAVQAAWFGLVFVLLAGVGVWTKCLGRRECLAKYKCVAASNELVALFGLSCSTTHPNVESTCAGSLLPVDNVARATQVARGVFLGCAWFEFVVALFVANY
jgi:hypothetical protein